VGLENITLDENEVIEDTTLKKKRATINDREDRYLVQSWLNVSKDVIVGMDKKATVFWSRVTDNYNEHCHPSLKEKKLSQLKSP